MEILKSQIELKVFGTDYKLTPPTALKSAEFKKEVSALTDEVDVVKKAIEFLVESGLSKDVCDQLELHHLERIIELIASKKK